LLLPEVLSLSLSLLPLPLPLPSLPPLLLPLLSSSPLSLCAHELPVPSLLSESAELSAVPLASDALEAPAPVLACPMRLRPCRRRRRFDAPFFARRGRSATLARRAPAAGAA
jgi:hypothetical protein